MSEWKKVKLGNLSTIFSGFAFKSKDMNNIGGIPIIKIKNINNFIVSTVCDSYLNTNIELGKYERFKLQPNDFLIAMTGQGSVGRVGKMMNYSPIFYVNQRVAIVRPDIEKVNPYYLYKCLATNEREKELFNKANGAGQPNISPAQIGDLDLAIPNLPTQHCIATILSRYDSLIENYQKQIKLLEEAAQRLYKEWFVNLHFPGHENTKIIDGVPEGWEKKPISQLGEYLNGFAFKPSDWQESGKPIIKIKEMGNGVNNDTPRNNGERVPAKYLVKAGDLLFSWSATLMVIVWSGEEGWLNQHLFKVTPAKGIGREFLLQSISNTIEEFLNLTTGSTMKHIQRNKLDQVFVNVPNDEIMKLYSSIAEKEREELLHFSSQIRLLTEARDRLLPKLMSGEIAV